MTEQANKVEATGTNEQAAPEITEAQVLRASSRKEHTVKRILEERIGELKEHINQRLDKIEKSCQDTLKQINERNKVIQGFLMREVKFDIANKLHNAQVTMDAFLEVLKENNLGIEDIDAKIDAKKKEIHERLEKEAEERMKERISGEGEQKADAPATPAEEAPQPEQQA